MNPPFSLQQAWKDAEPSLARLKQQLQEFPNMLGRTLRVGQIDAELLDQELLQILSGPVSKALGLINSSYSSRFEPESAFILSLLLYKFSVWDLGATYGAKLQNLHYVTSSFPPSGNDSPLRLRKRILWLHGIATVLIPYLHRRFRIYALSHAWPDAPSKNYRRKFWENLTRLEAVHNALGLVSFIAFLYNGKYRTIADRLLRLRLVPTQNTASRQVSYEFMNRQMVWHAFTEFLIFLFPLINTRLLRRRLTRAYEQTLSFAKQSFGLESAQLDQKQSNRGKYWFLPEDQCAICVENAGYSATVSLQNSLGASKAREDSTYPLNTPYVTSCLHKYCYVCIADRLLRAADDGETSWSCLRCGSAVLTADRVTKSSNGDDGDELDDILSDDNGGFLMSTDS
ncbi:hypothetical protein Clacol_001507 [Clathrus columnatus]|uniref:RING-type E3 ubiquitin transferase (cysteine targeting) n=1 Tax=Clathrus columnatus TaxID=1419009 RepID=A0AAV4ZYE0_9AGAM|nr:hypothetical protein Clacol_001507 [Clathrus columnatus]